MAILGGSVTNKFVLGNFELRVGPQELAGKLTSEHSVGIVDKFSLSSQQETVDLNALFPQEIVDTEIVSQTSQLTATIREFSHRNFNLLAGNGLPSTVKKGAVVSYSESGSGAKKGVTVVSTSLVKGVATTADNVPFYLKPTLGTPVKFTRKSSTFDLDTHTLTLDAAAPSYSSGVNNIISTALDTSLEYSYLYYPMVIPTGLDTSFVVGYLGNTSATATPSTNFGILSTSVSGSDLTVTLKVYVDDSPATYEVSGSGATKKDVKGLLGKFFVILWKNGSNITAQTFPITAITVSTNTLTVTGTITGVGSVNGTAVAYFFANTATKPSGSDLTVYTSAYGAANAVTNYDSGLVYTAVLPGTLSSASGEYVGAVIRIDSTGKKASISAYDGATHTATLTNSLKVNASDPVAPKAFTLSLNNTAFSAVLAARSNDSITGIKLNTLTVLGYPTTPALPQDVTDWVATAGGKTATVTSFNQEINADGSISTYVGLSSALSTGVATAFSISKLEAGASVITVQETGSDNDVILNPDTALLIFDTEDPTESQIVRVQNAEAHKDADGLRNININPPLTFTPESGVHEYRVELIDQINFGKQTGSQYFTASLVMLDRANGLPVVLDFWKVTLASGINLSVNPNEFASTDMVLSILEPTLEDKKTTYSSIASLVNANPLYRIAALPDAVTLA